MLEVNSHKVVDLFLGDPDGNLNTILCSPWAYVASNPALLSWRNRVFFQPPHSRLA